LQWDEIRSFKRQGEDGFAERLREKGLFEHQLQQWQQSFCAMGAGASEANVRHAQTQLRELQAKNATLQRDLSRKDRALAETAALLVLQKKFQALLEDVAK
jgi:ABC-type taurine transport system substrate-binding protein